MDQQAIDAFTAKVRDAVFAARGLAAEQLVDLGGFESFVLACGARDSILRITHASHRSHDQIMAEIEWIEDLHANGAAVCRPIRGASNELVTTVGEFHACEFERARGRVITRGDWTDDLFKTWGENIGRFHRLARAFEPGCRRIEWFEDENFSIEGRVPADQGLVHERMASALEALRTLPAAATNYGLIHCDAHAGNFFLEAGAQTFFDFDDACYCWFGYDVATILFGAVRQDWMENSRRAEAAEARSFLPAFLEGYGRESDPAHLLPAAWNVFLEVRELGLYGVIHAHAIDTEDARNAYASRFMQGRRQRIEAGEPYLDVDFAAFF